MKFFTYIIIFILFSIELQAQDSAGILTGKVSFASSQSTYVKFKSTEGISAGDTLFIYSKGKITPVLIVKNLSSGSCLCTSISSINLSISQDVITKKKSPALHKETENSKEKVKDAQIIPKTTDSVKPVSGKNKLSHKTDGSLSVYSYSDFSNTAAKNSTQLRYTYRLNARNIGNSKFSLDNYITFRHKIGDWARVKNDLFNALKIYSFSLKYEPSENTKISLGRTINYRISSIGAMDGLQVEQTFNKFSVGAVAGSRPDYRNYGFDSKLLQYGGFIAFDTKAGASFSESSLAFMQQMNNMKTDRRFLYFQHSNSLLKNLNFFGTVEADLYTVKNNLPQNTFNLTGLYLSLRYRITKNFSLTGSFDQRKNIQYYETYKTLIDSVLENERRQSFRLQGNYRISDNISIGLESGYRFLKSDARPSKNLNGYLTYYRMPGLNLSLTLSGTYLESAYMDGKVFSVDVSKDLFQGIIQTSVGYRYIDYTLPESGTKLLQNVAEMSIFWQVNRKISFSASYEGTFEKADKYSRIYLQLRKRF
jgi:hypothetical protein